VYTLNDNDLRQAEAVVSRHGVSSEATECKMTLPDGTPLYLTRGARRGADVPWSVTSSSSSVDAMTFLFELGSAGSFCIASGDVVAVTRADVKERQSEGDLASVLASSAEELGVLLKDEGFQCELS